MRRIDATDLYLATVLTLLRVTETANSIALCERFAAVIGGTAARTSRRKYQNTLRALSDYFGTRHDARTLRRIARQTFHTFWLDAFVLCQLDWRAVLDAAQITGLEHLEHAHARGRGVILLENSYFGLRNLAKRILHARGWQIHQTHATNHLAGFSAPGSTTLRQRVLHPAFEEREKNFVASIVHIPTDGSFDFVRAIARLLANNAAVYFSGDGDTSHKFIAIDFLGRRAPFPTGIVNLARLSGAPIVPLFCFRDQKQRVVLRVEPPLEFPDNARAAEIGMAHYAARYAQYIDTYPEQYRNWYSLNK
jgi:KDO2-lipid IV(A) lauroyltransferase